MARKADDSFNPHKNTASRRQLIDYDYLDKLSSEEYKWLAKFTDEYMGADYEINPTFCAKDDAIKVCSNELLKVVGDAKKTSLWTKKLEYYTSLKTKNVQISQNSEKVNNLDLRKCRSITLFRKNSNGRLSKNPKWKYNSIHDPKTHLKDCNERSSDSAEDIFSVQRVIKQEANEYCVDNQVAGGWTPEQWLIYDEIDKMIEDFDNED